LRKIQKMPQVPPKHRYHQRLLRDQGKKFFQRAQVPPKVAEGTREKRSSREHRYWPQRLLRGPGKKSCSREHRYHQKLLRGPEKKVLPESMVPPKVAEGNRDHDLEERLLQMKL
jgi:hypothetical protein